MREREGNSQTKMEHIIIYIYPYYNPHYELVLASVGHGKCRKRCYFKTRFIKGGYNPNRNINNDDNIERKLWCAKRNIIII